MTEKKEPIVIASDHYGLTLKDPIRDYLIEKGYEVIDLGVNSDEPVLYPEIAIKLSEEVLKHHYSRGILVCGTGVGMAMVANKVPGVRAAVIHDAYSAECARASNDAQVAALGSQVIGLSTAHPLNVHNLESEYAGGRSLPKAAIIKEMDEKKWEK